MGCTSVGPHKREKNKKEKKEKKGKKKRKKGRVKEKGADQICLIHQAFLFSPTFLSPPKTFSFLHFAPTAEHNNQHSKVFSSSEEQRWGTIYALNQEPSPNRPA